MPTSQQVKLDIRSSYADAYLSFINTYQCYLRFSWFFAELKLEDYVSRLQNDSNSVSINDVNWQITASLESLINQVFTLKTK